MSEDRKYYYAALVVGLLFHVTSSIFNFEGTYDAYVHMFFANHYAGNWFESWNAQWYTGFTITSYPPLVHQIIALLSKLVGLKMGFLIWSWVVVLLMIRGVYRFSNLFVGKQVAGYAALVAVFSTAIGEALHIFGQLPSSTGTALLLNLCPEVYLFVRYMRKVHLVSALSILAMTSAAHHVSTIFGMVFFIFPVIGMALYDAAGDQSDKEKIGLWDLVKMTRQRIIPIGVFGVVAGVITIVVTFPYWAWSRADPITQVPIPHGSRDNFLEVTSSGLVFFLIPWGVILLILPYLGKKLLRKRNLPLALSFALCMLFGTGGTTTLPKMLLGDTAFNILTLDRFTFWGAVMSLPFMGLIFCELVRLCREHTRRFNLYITMLYLLGGATFVSAIMVANLPAFKKIQPDPIDVQPIVNFINRDGHSTWRYLTLGFGDQVAWLSANTRALTVDGNYHSARRLPEMTSRAVERLENAKYLGNQGISTLQQFLTFPEKYKLKYIFSNDKFYEPLLYFAGWNKLPQLENKVAVWERPDVPGLPQILPRKSIPRYQSYMWGILPLSAMLFALLWQILMKVFRWHTVLDVREGIPQDYSPRWIWVMNLCWIVLILIGTIFIALWLQRKNNPHSSPENLVQSFFHQLDFKQFSTAHSMLDPDDRPSMEEYLTDLSLDGGMLSSYASLDTVLIDLEKETDNRVVAQVTASWITSLSSYTTEHELILQKSRSKWYIKAQPYNRRFPPDRYLVMPQLDFYAQGRRQAGNLDTDPDDILDRPDLIVLNARLVRKDEQYHIVGELMNIDADPAYVVLTGILYDTSGKMMVEYAAMDVINHRLLPKEQTGFRIDFRNAAISRGLLGGPDSLELDSVARFAVFARSTVLADRVYRGLSAYDLDASDGVLSGNLVNAGAIAVSVPQILAEYHDQDGIMWVDKHYPRDGIRPQRQQFFTMPMTAADDVETLLIATDDMIDVNGVGNREFRRLIPEFSNEIHQSLIDGRTIRIEVNPMILNPTVD